MSVTDRILSLPQAVLPASPHSTCDPLPRRSSPGRRNVSEPPPHQQVGRQGEEAAYFYLRRRGYIMVARNFRSPHRRGEIDLIGWDKDVLCFIEVKTRTTHDVKPAEAAVDRAKRHDLSLVAQQYLRLLSAPCPWRFDVVSVYYDHSSLKPEFELFQNVSSMA